MVSRLILYLLIAIAALAAVAGAVLNTAKLLGVL